ncbi:MAG: zf-HC2 domain-containing protein [Thermodesulfobacteriota bacterium]
MKERGKPRAELQHASKKVFDTILILKGREVMKCKDILEKLSEYLDGELDPKLCQDIERHMEDCHPCLVFVNTLKKTITLYKFASSEPLPKEVHLRLHDYLKKECKGS